MSLASSTFVIWTQPNCPHCDRAKKLIHERGFPFIVVDITKVAADTKAAFVNGFEPKHRTVPKIYINGALIGGADDLEKWLESPDFAVMTAQPVYPPLLVKRITPTAIMPSRGSNEAIGLDLYADLGVGDSIHIFPNEVVTIPTGWAFKPPVGHYLRVAPRSGLAIKQGIDTLAGVIDRDYRGELVVALTTHGHKNVVINHADRIAQLIMERATISVVTEVAELDDTERGEKGFGSTG